MDFMVANVELLVKFIVLASDNFMYQDQITQPLT
jgi:hypothetical protein